MRSNDRNWVRGMFGRNAFSAGSKGENVREYTVTNGSFADTTIGGNMAINPNPQFTRFADQKCYGYLARGSDGSLIQDGQAGSYGMGRFYGETTERAATYAHFRFGLPKYIGMLSFITTMYNPDIARLTTDGMFSGFFRTVGKTAAYAGAFVILGPSICLPLYVGTKLIEMFLDIGVSKYWYVNPQMHLYLQAAQAMCDTQLVHSRLVPFSSLLNSDRPDVQEGPNHQLVAPPNEWADGNRNHATVVEMYKALPSIWKSNGKFDLFKMINRYQILHDFQARNIEDIFNHAKDMQHAAVAIDKYIRQAQVRDEMITRAQMEMGKAPTGESLSISEAIANAYIYSTDYQVDETKDVAKGREVAAARERFNAEHDTSKQMAAQQDEQQKTDKANEQAAADAENENVVTTLAKFITSTTSAFKNSTWGSTLIAELHDGAQWITFKVDGKGSVSDSFGNSTVEPQIASAINGISSQARSIEMNTSGGKTGLGVVDAATDAVKNIMAGALDSFNLSALAGVLGRSSVDIPEMWDSSNADIATESYTIHLRSPYGNDMSLFQNITVPLMLILAGTLPMATGKQTHRNPFYCEVICPGRSVIRNGMITNVSITRGAGNIGWRPDGRMLGCDVTITVKDLSKVVAMPIIKNPKIFSDDNLYTDYMATLGSATLHDLTYRLAKLTLNFNMWKQSWKSYLMEGQIMNSVASRGPARLIAQFVTGTARN